MLKFPTFRSLACPLEKWSSLRCDFENHFEPHRLPDATGPAAAQAMAPVRKFVGEFAHVSPLLRKGWSMDSGLRTAAS